jgi:hypothetical protein
MDDTGRGERAAMTQGEKTLTPKQFVKAYAKKSGVPLQRLVEEDWVVLSCDCDYPSCQGWTMESRDYVEDHAFFWGGPITKGPVYYLKDMEF